jgi:hypothetical protein
MRQFRLTKFSFLARQRLPDSLFSELSVSADLSFSKFRLGSHVGAYFYNLQKQTFSLAN